MSDKTGGPAFPSSFDVPNLGPEGVVSEITHSTIIFQGMTLRDYFAAKVMQGFATDPGWAPAYAEKLAQAAYELADAMLAERKK